MDINTEIPQKILDFNSLSTDDMRAIFDYLKSLAKEYKKPLNENKKFSDEEWKSIVDTACSVHKKIEDIYKATPERKGGNMTDFRGSLASIIDSKKFKSNSAQTDINIQYIKKFYQEIIICSNLPEAE